MKKLLFLSLLVGMFYGNAAVSATYNCEYQKIYDQYANHNLFVGDIVADGSGYGFACGHEGVNGCSQDEQILVSGSHWFDNFSRDGIKGYSCNSKTWDDKWENLDVNKIRVCENTTGWSEFGVLKGVHIFCKNPVTQNHRDGRSAVYCARSSNICRCAGDRVYDKESASCVSQSNGSVTPVVPGDKTGKCIFPGGKQHEVGDSVEYDCSKITGTDFYANNAKTGKKCYLSCMQRNFDGAIENVWSVKDCASGTDKKVKFSMPEQVYTQNIPGYKKCVKGDNGDCPKGEKRAEKDLNLSVLACDGTVCNPIFKGRCYPEDMLRCLEAINDGESAVWNDKRCICIATGKDLDPKTGKCGTGSNESLCAKLESSGATAERLACCRAGRDTQWIKADGSVDVDVTDTGQGGGYCECKEKDFKWENRDCKKSQSDDDVVVIPDGDNDVCRYTFTIAARCPNSNKVIQENTVVTFNKSEVDGLDDCNDFDTWYKQKKEGYLSVVETLCENNEYAKDVTLDQQTRTAISEVNKFFNLSNSDRTVWRTEEGKFNTARLASDATAGVVLGTVGGIVSGKIIKKKQLEKGFDVLHCTVGGQKTADYGDTFRVTYQR